MARALSARPMSLPAATSSTALSPPFAGFTTALRASQGQSGIPEVPSSGLPSPPSSPPLAVLDASNQLALTPKKRNARGANTARSNRRGGAALRIREECERFFCETMMHVFLGEEGTATHGSILTGAYNNHNYYHNGQLCTPPDDDYAFPSQTATAVGGSHGTTAYMGKANVTAWLEVWDYAGGASFRGFLAETAGETSLFAFFEAGIAERDLKQALVALIELSDSALGCSQLIVCVDRATPDEEAKALIKGLGWAGFSLTTLDHWTGGHLDVTSKKWVFMGMDI